jgi:hypothetical protein
MSQAEAATWGKRPTAKKDAPKPVDAAALDKFVNGAKGKTARLNAEIDADLRARFKARCALEKREIRDVISELIEGWMKEMKR